MRRNCGDRDTLLDQKAWCKKCGVDYKANKEEIRKLNSLIIVLGKKALGEYEKDKPVWSATKDAVKEIEDCESYLTSITDLGINPNKTEQQRSLVLLFCYLLLVEGYYSKIVNILSIMLVANDHDLYDPKANEFITNYEQLDKIDLAIKMKFLKKHGFGYFVAPVDKTLRNDIAHLNVQVTKEGKIINRKNGKEQTDIRNKIIRLNWMCLLVGCVLDYVFWKGKDPSY